MKVILTIEEQDSKGLKMLDLLFMQLVRVFGWSMIVLILIAICVFAVIGAATVCYMFWSLYYMGSLGV